MHKKMWKIGELAAESDVSVRTLHWYDKIGILRPTHRTGSGHRVYESDDVERLQQIRSLQALGLSLEEIKTTLNSSEFSPRDLLQKQITRLRKQIEKERRLCEQLERIAAGLDSNMPPEPSEFLAAIKEMQMMEKIESYYTDQQLATLKERVQALGQEHI